MENYELIGLNYKGTRCPLRSILCQEGICSGCEIYQAFFRRLESNWDHITAGVSGKGLTAR